MKINLEYSILDDAKIKAALIMAEKAHNTLISGNGPGAEFTGWIDYAGSLDPSFIEEIKATANFIKKSAEILIVIGVGGSYSGSRAVIKAISPYISRRRSDGCEIVFAGQNLSADYLAEIRELIKRKEVCVNVISKSGRTLESAIAFRVVKVAMEEKYGSSYASRVFVTTGSSGALKDSVEKYGYTAFSVPENIGGRYSVMTPVGLLPIAVAGGDLDSFIRGFADAQNSCEITLLSQKYAAARMIYYEQGKVIEALVTYDPKLEALADWWVQLFGESDGKDGKGIFPTKLNYTTDLHSMGQMIQDGKRHLFETLLLSEKRVEEFELELPFCKDDFERLNHISRKPISFATQAAVKGTLLAHLEGGVPNLLFLFNKLDEYNLAKIMYFFMKACAIGGYMMGINPFDQPGVEAYKLYMRKILND